MTKQAIIDKYAGFVISKTYTVFLFATVALFVGKLSGSEWSALAIFYVVGEKGISMIKLFRPKKEEE